MVYIKPVLASAVAFTLVSSVAALPAHRNVARDNAAPASDDSNPPPDSYPSKRDGPMVVQAKSLQATKRGYVGGGAGGAKKLKQAPLMKAAKLFRSKRDVVEARDEHIHEHIHEHDHEDDHHHHDHDDHHHHHDDDYDHHHSEHYNYHHGLTDHDAYHHHHERDLINIAALNNNSPSNNKVKKINKIHKSSKKIGKINKCKGSHFHCNQHKRDETSTGNDADGEDNTMMEDAMDNTRLVRRRKNSNGHRYKNNGYHKNNNNGWKSKQGGGDKTIKANTEISTGGFKRTGVLPGKMNPGLSARHHDHHDHHDDHKWEHEHEHVHYHDHEDEHVHEHVHSHEHKRNLSARRHEHDHEDEHVHMHIHEDEHYDHHHHNHHEHHHNDKRRHRDHDDDAWLDEMTYHREWRDGHAHIHLHEHDHDHDHYHGHHHHHHHDKRQTTQNGIPGFVEVANTLAGTTLAKSVAGLVFSKGPDPNASGFLLGTSDTQSTQFYLVPNQDSSSIETSQSVNATRDTPEDNAKTYQLRIPVLDNKTFESNDYCATFDVLPPSPMTMAPCKYKGGFSQIFKYNATTGELTPVYPPTDSNPKPMNAAVRYSEPQVMAAKFPVTDNQVPAAAPGDLSAATGMPSSSAGSSTWSTDSAMSTADASASSSDASATDSSSSSAAAPQSSSSATPSDGTAPADAPKVSLFFIPASTYASGKDSSSSTPEQSSTLSSSTSTTSDSPLFSALPAQAKIVTPSDGNQDWSNVSDDSGVVTTTVVVTSTMDAESAQATPAAPSDWPSSDASSGESQAWTTTDGPTQ